MDKYKKNLSEIQNNSILIYSGIQRESSTVTKDLVSQIKQKQMYMRIYLIQLLRLKKYYNQINLILNNLENY